jgi:hypothetical protein
MDRAYSLNLLGTATSATLTDAAVATTGVSLKFAGAFRWALQLNYEGLAGDGADTFHPILQTSYDGGTTWQDVASTASMAGGVVAAVTEFIEALTPKAAARVAASDGAIAASTINTTSLGRLVRLKGKFSDVDHDGQWRLNSAILLIYPAA